MFSKADFRKEATKLLKQLEEGKADPEEIKQRLSELKIKYKNNLYNKRKSSMTCSPSPTPRLKNQTSCYSSWMNNRSTSLSRLAQLHKTS